MKNKLKPIILCFSLIITLVMSTFIITAIPDEETPKTQYETITEKIQILEILAQQFLTTNNIKYYSPQELACIYIRCDRYSSGSWNFLAGSKNQQFEQYVESIDPSIKILKAVTSLILPNGDSTDFIHMMAAINMYEEKCGPLGSWAGDTAQLVTNIKNKNRYYRGINRICLRII